MSEKRKPSYWAVLPASVRYDPALPSSAKLLYAEVSALCDELGYCFATNDYFASNFELSTKSVQRLLKDLADHGYITVDVVRDPKTNAVLERRIYAGINPAASAPTPHLKNKVRSPQNCGDPSPQKCGEEQLYNINTNTPAPDGGRGGRRRRAPRDTPDWKPERFAGLWKFYPKSGRKNKQDAMNAWDKLRPSDELIDTIAKALIKLKATDEWRRGIGIPYVSTFLNGCRWRDAEEIDAADDAPDTDAGWAPDSEVL